MRPIQCVTVVVLIASLTSQATASSDPVEITVFEDVEVSYDSSISEGTERDNHRVFRSGQLIERTVDLPSAPENLRDAQRIIATVTVEPILITEDDKVRPGDPWTRLGSVTVKRPGKNKNESERVELMRFITGFGGPGTFTQDVTAYAPILSGKTTLQLFLSTYMNPGWKVSLKLTYASDDVGYRRPIWAKRVFFDETIKSDQSTRTSVIQVPQDLARPRLHVISTGHATDGSGGDEFVSRTHVLKIDGVEMCRWRPWVESGESNRDANPTSGRMTIDGRELYSSDLDRSGWRPGEIVKPLHIPVPELTPGKHTIELSIIGIRPQDDSGMGYWRTSVTAVADEPWPDESPE